MLEDFDLDVELTPAAADGGASAWACSTATSAESGSAWACSTAAADGSGSAWACTTSAPAV